MKCGTRFLRVAAAGVPQAALGFVPHLEEPHSVYCCECGHDHPVLVDEYYFWLIDTNQYDAQDDSQDSSPDGSGDGFQSSFQFGYQDSYYDQVQQQSTEWNDDTVVPQLLAKWQPSPAVRLAWCRLHNCEFGEPRRSDDYVAISEQCRSCVPGPGRRLALLLQ